MLAVLLPCAGSPQLAVAAPMDPRPGIGRSTAEPTGTALELPVGLMSPERFAGYSEDHCRRDDDSRTDLEIGHGLNVQVCLSLINTTAQPITLSLPAGLIFVSWDDETQNGLLITTETFEIPPGDEPFFVRLGLHCLNIGRSPSGLGDDFRLGPVTGDPLLHRLLERLDGHQLTDEDVMYVQNLVWNATDDISLTPPDRAWLAALADR